MPLRKFVAPEFLFGAGAIDLAGQYASNLGGSRALIVSDEGVIEAGWTDSVKKVLGDTGVTCTVFSDVTPNPKDHEVMKGAEYCLSESCDIIVAVGGGSPMDCAKGIAIITANGGLIADYSGVDMVPLPGPPLICVPTTAGTAADISQFAIIGDTERRIKFAIISKSVVPDVSLIDPSATSTMDSKLTAETGMDALVHAFESYVSNASSPVTDLNALEAVKLISRNLRRAVENPHDMASREKMMLGSLLAGLAFSNASLGLVHAMAHSLGGFYGSPHGECNALLLENVVNFNFDSESEKYTQLGEAMGLALLKLKKEERKEALAEGLSIFRKNSGIYSRLNDLGVKPEDIPSLADYAAQDTCAVTNPRAASRKDIERLYEESL